MCRADCTSHPHLNEVRGGSLLGGISANRSVTEGHRRCLSGKKKKKSKAGDLPQDKGTIS